MRTILFPGWLISSLSSALELLYLKTSMFFQISSSRKFSSPFTSIPKSTDYFRPGWQPGLRQQGRRGEGGGVS
eukprot:364840-Chlamydomonas_euryale.AAC.15